MKQVSYYSKKLLFAVFVVTMFYAILFQKGTLEIYLAQNDGVKLPVLSQLFLEMDIEASSSNTSIDKLMKAEQGLPSKSNCSENNVY